MTSLLLRHYDVTLAYRALESDRRLRDFKKRIRMFVNRRQLRRKLRSFFVFPQIAE